MVAIIPKNGRQIVHHDGKRFIICYFIVEFAVFSLLIIMLMHYDILLEGFHSSINCNKYIGIHVFLVMLETPIKMID